MVISLVREPRIASFPATLRECESNVHVTFDVQLLDAEKNISGERIREGWPPTAFFPLRRLEVH